MKEYREKELKYLMIILILLFLVWCTPILSLDITDIETLKIISTVLESVIVSSVLSLGTFLSDSLISSRIKDKLVGLFFIPKAGATIFTRINNDKVADDRFTTLEAKNKYSEIISELPSDKKTKYNYENAQWYKIYQKHKDKGAVSQCQKDYLICRDLFIETIIFLVLYFIILIAFNDVTNFSWNLISVFVVISVVTNIATHVKMNRFVNTVIAVDISNNN